MLKKRLKGILFESGHRSNAASYPLIQLNFHVSIKREKQIQSGSKFYESHLLSLTGFPIFNCIAPNSASHIASHLTNQYGTEGGLETNGISFIEGG